jgi:fructosamine-3-kinase
MSESFAALVAQRLSSEVRVTTRLGGGDVAEAYRVELSDGSTLFAKTHRSPPPGFFVTEADGLSSLRAALTEGGNEPSALRVPKVVAVADDLLVLEWIELGRPQAATEEDFGRGLARLHRRDTACFGRRDRRTTGSRRLPNEPTSTWADFYAASRLLPLARLARDGRSLPDHVVDRVENLATQLERFGAADEPPALLHGDLWAGNRMLGRGGVNWLIDPAVHGGHREFDLAMMALFGGFGEQCWLGYDDEFPLAEGWRSRAPLHQLAPLLVHAIKFGGSYPAAVAQALDDCERLDDAAAGDTGR